MSLVSETTQALSDLFCCQTQSDRGRQHTKNGGAPWLPEPCMENNDEPSLHRRLFRVEKNGMKTTQNARIPVKTTSVQP